MSTPTDDAIGWLVLLRSGEATPADQNAFDDWLRRSPAHGAAWQRLAGPVDGAFAAARALNQRVPGQADTIAQALADAATHAQRRRRMLRGALALGGMGLGTGLLAQRFTPLQDALADLRTGTGERRRFALADGSTLLLNARSAVDVAYTGSERAVRLRGGECIASVQPEPDAALRPFVARCRDGSVHVHAGAAATRFLLRQESERSLAVALEGGVELAPADAPAARQWLAPGQAAWITPTGTTPGTEAAPTAAAWQQGLFVVNDRPLGEVVDALRPYRHGLLRIAPEAARLRVHGSYPLDDTGRALTIIADTLPVAVHVYRGGWLVRIEAG